MTQERGMGERGLQNTGAYNPMHSTAEPPNDTAKALAACGLQAGASTAEPTTGKCKLRVDRAGVRAYLEDFQAGLMNCADHGPASAYCILHCPHHDGCSPSVQACSTCRCLTLQQRYSTNANMFWPCSPPLLETLLCPNQHCYKVQMHTVEAMYEVFIVTACRLKVPNRVGGAGVQRSPCRDAA